MSAALPVVLRCADTHLTKVRYVFDTLFMARAIPVVYCTEPPSSGPWLLYAPVKDRLEPHNRCFAVAHCPEAWQFFDREADIQSVESHAGLESVLPYTAAGLESPNDIPFDIAANAFYFLCSWSERAGPRTVHTRRLYADSVFARLAIPQDIVDRYLVRLIAGLDALCDRLGQRRWDAPGWPDGTTYAVVLSHDVDFLPSGLVDTLRQGAKTLIRHLVNERDPADALRAMSGLTRALMRRNDPYGCVPEIIDREKKLGVRSSFQIAVARRHPNDVNYRIENDRVRDYLRVISDSGFDLCLHGSYRSTENSAWYGEEAALLARLLDKPLGSRQHFLSFDYDNLFAAQERAGIEYDMSMGYPDRTGPRAGFSYPYFPYCLKDDRPYTVLQLSLFLMDVTLRSYLRLKPTGARKVIDAILDELQRKGGCVSAVWHPIVFGSARDPGYDDLYWDMIERIRNTGGLATDGRTINAFWRHRAGRYASFNSKPPLNYETR